MCSGTEQPTCLCEECESKQEEWQEKDNTAEGMPEEMLCESCKEKLTRFCWSCGVLYDNKEEACIEEDICKNCRG